MSTAPPTTAKVLLHTNKGPIEIELWAKEIPLASRNFLQLCMDGYYDNCEFHRVVPDFIVQTGDPTGTGFGGDAIYENGVFNDEFHSRIRYTRRGLVGCANKGERNTNGSQFIITLTATPELDRKNTCFGTVVGDTLYNVFKIGESEVGENERPLYPPKITKAEVIVPYFEDLQPRRQNVVEQKKIEPTKKKKKAVVSMNFDEDEEIVPIIKPRKKTITSKEEKKVEPVKELKQKPTRLVGDDKEEQEASKLANESSLEKLEDEFAALKAAMKSKPATVKKPEPTLTALEEEQKKSHGEKQARLTKKGKGSRDAETLAVLKSFQAKLSGKPFDQMAATVVNLPADEDSEPELGSEDELPSDYEEQEDKWDGSLLNHKFTYDGQKVENEDLLMTIDPLERKERQDQIYKEQDPRGDLKRLNEPQGRYQEDGKRRRYR